jgi:VCBS repeat-containing protein
MSTKVFAVNNAFATTATAAIAIDATENDSDTTGAPLSVLSLNLTGTKGAATIDPTTGLIDYSPGTAFDYLNIGQTATDSFKVTVTDGLGDTAVATVTITITGVELPPIAVAERYTINAYEYCLSLTPTAEDTDYGRSNRLSVIAVNTTGTKGQVTLEAAYNLVLYSPNSAFDYLSQGETATDSFQYTISDGHGGTSTGTITITIDGVNVAPVAHPIAVTTGAYSSIAVNAVASDTDVNRDDILTITALNLTGTKGTASIDPVTGDIDYSPNGAFDTLYAGQTATDTLHYTVSDNHGASSSSTLTVTVTGVEVPPVAVAESATVNAYQSITLTPAAQDTEVNPNDHLTVTAIGTTGTKGRVTLQAGGLVLYNPNGAFNYLSQGETATDTFSYTVSDGHGGTGTGTVTVTIDGVNEPPVAYPVTAATGAYSNIAVNALASDTDVNRDDILTVTALNLAGTKGTATIDPVTGNIDYSPNSAFDYLSVGETATDTLQYTVSDNHGASSNSTLTVTITGVNVPPVAAAETAATYANQPVTLSPLLGDTDTNRDDTLSLVGVNTTGTEGAVTIEGNQLVYNPDGAFNGLAAGQTATDTFQYTVSDNHGATSTGTIAVTVTGVGAPPVIGIAWAATLSNTPVTINLLANDSDPNPGYTLTVTSLNLTGTQGTVTMGANGTVVYTPGGADASLPVGTSATDTFGYTVSDGHGGTASGIATVVVNGSSYTEQDLLGSGYLSTDGSQIVNAEGQAVRLVSAGWDGTDSQGFAPRDLLGVNYETTMQQMVEDGFNTIRIPWTDAMLTASPAPGTINYTLNPTLQGLDSVQVLQQIVAYAGQLGLKVIFDHQNDEGYGGQQANGLWYDVGGASNGTDGEGHTGTVSQQTFLTDTVNFAQLWAGNSTVIGFDLDNEPVKSTWAGPSTTSIQEMSTTVGDAIQAVDPGALIIVEPPPGGASAPEGDLSSVLTDPVALTDPDKVVYSVHEYPPSVNPAIFNGNPAQYIQQLNNAWGFLITDNIAPVWIGEMGSSLATATDQLWAQTLVNYMNGDYAAEGGPSVGAGQQGVGGDWWDWWDQPSGTLTGLLAAGYTGVKPDQFAIVQQMYPQAATSGSAPDTLILQVADTKATAGAVFAVYADGTQIGTSETIAPQYSGASVETFAFQGELGPGLHTIAIDQFNNTGTIQVSTVDYDGALQSLTQTNATGGADQDYAVVGPSVLNAGTTFLGDDTAVVTVTQPDQMVFLAAGTHAIANQSSSCTLDVTGGSATLTGFSPAADQVDLIGGIGGYATAAQAASAVIADGAGGALLPLGTGSLDFAGVSPTAFSASTFVISATAP